MDERNDERAERDDGTAKGEGKAGGQFYPARLSRNDKLNSLARPLDLIEMVGQILGYAPEEIGGDKMSDEDRDDEEEEEEEYCPLCQGTGIGQFGDPDTSRCLLCRGTGMSRERRCADETERGDIEYHRRKEDELCQ